jgi:hypothetical protein
LRELADAKKSVALRFPVLEEGAEYACLPLLEVLSKRFGISVSELMKGV